MPMGFYDDEAARYDATRGGQARADAAATALDTLLPATGTIIDVGGGTGILSATLHRTDRPVYVLDASAGMLAHAHRRLPGHAVRADATRLPLRTGTVPAVTAIWLLHLLPDDVADAATADIARVLAPGGVFTATVNKNAAHDVGSDLDAIMNHLHDTVGLPRTPSDDRARLTAHLHHHGLTETAHAHFTGTGQGRTPATLAAHLTGGHHFTWATHLTQDAIDDAVTALHALPDPHRPRPDPTYTITAWRKHP